MNNVINYKEQLVLAEKALKLQQKNNRNAEIQNRAGLMSLFDLLQIQVQLRGAQQKLLNTQIGYINQLVELNKTIGTTLDNWGIKIRY